MIPTIAEHNWVMSLHSILLFCCTGLDSQVLLQGMCGGLWKNLVGLVDGYVMLRSRYRVFPWHLYGQMKERSNLPVDTACEFLIVVRLW